jgi:hypothetical protein
VSERSFTPLRDSLWSPLVDHRRVHSAEVFDCLRRLARMSVEHIFASGPAPRVSRREAARLKPFLGAVRFAPGARAAAARSLNTMLLLSPKVREIGRNDVAVLIDTSRKRHGFMAGLRARFLASRSPIVGGDTFLSCFEEIAFADTALSEHVMALARGEWRRRTFFYPDEPAWPDALSAATFQVLLALALERPQPRWPARLFGRHRRAVLERIEVGLAQAIEALAGRSEVEQMILADAAKKTLPQGLRPAHVAVARLPICRLDSYVDLQRAVAESYGGTSEENNAHDKEASPSSSAAPVVARLGSGSI